MAASTQRKDYPLSMRMPDCDIAIIDRAARLRGRSRTDFVREAALKAAEETLLESHLIRMSADSFDAFLKVLEQPAAAVPELVEVVARPAPWEAGYVKPDRAQE